MSPSLLAANQAQILPHSGGACLPPCGSTAREPRFLFGVFSCTHPDLPFGTRCEGCNSSCSCPPSCSSVPGLGLASSCVRDLAVVALSIEKSVYCGGYVKSVICKSSAQKDTSRCQYNSTTAWANEVTLKPRFRFRLTGISGDRGSFPGFPKTRTPGFPNPEPTSLGIIRISPDHFSLHSRNARSIVSPMPCHAAIAAEIKLCEILK